MMALRACCSAFSLPTASSYAGQDFPSYSYLLPAMNAVKKIKNGIKKCDFFNTTEFLRYHGEPQHQTFMGGAFSMVLIIVLLVAFSNKVLNTLNMLSITSTSTNKNADDPEPLILSTSGAERVNFMFGVEIWHHNLNEGERYFDISLVNQNYNYGEPTDKSKFYTLEPCTLDHWRGYPAIQKKFDDLNMHYWLCLPKGIDYQVGGKYSSPVQNTIEVSVNQCTNTSIDPANPRYCASNELIDQYFRNSSQKIFFTIYFVNPLINPDIAEFLTYYLEDSNYIIFSRTGGEEAQIMMEDYTITTDNSISPLSDYSEVTGGIVGKNAIKNRFEISADNTNYCTFFIFKSPNSREIERGYVKLDEILSYIGGLFGTLTMCLFIVRIYNNYAFQINLGAVLYKKDEKEVNLKKFNFLYFLAQLVYRALREKFASCNWGAVKGYFKCREEVLKQIDVLYLLKRVTFLERATEILLDSHQLKGVHLLKHLSIDQAKKNRRNFKLHEKAILECERLEYQRKNSHTTGRMKPPQSIGQGNKVDNDDSINMQDESPNKKSDSKLGKELATISQSSNDKEEDIYDSQSSSQDEEEVQENEENTLTLLLQLKKEKDVSPVSKRIYENLNETLKDFIDKYEENQSENGSVNQDAYNQLLKNNIKVIDFRPRKRFRQLPKVEESHFNKLINRQPLALDNSQNVIQVNDHFFEDISVQ